MNNQSPSNNQSPFQISQGYEVLVPRFGKAYPIPCEEWDFLKKRIEKVSHPPSFFQNAGSLLLGACLSTLITIFIGGFPAATITIAWAAVCVTGILGIFALIFADFQLKEQRIQASDVVSQMEIIERRYEHSAVIPSPQQAE